MIRTFAIATLLSAGLTTAVAANERSADATSSPAAFTAQLTAVANQQQMRKLLARQGYIVTSDLNRDDSGHWVGTALKDGMAMSIAVKLPPRNAAAPLTN